jgi:hypothetical protein
MICCFFSSFKTFAMLREATYPPAAVNVLDVSSESMAAFQVFSDSGLTPRAVLLRRFAIKELEEAYLEHSMDLVFLQQEPNFDFLHSDPRYRELVKKTGLRSAY